jgi:hypothetical protein
MGFTKEGWLGVLLILSVPLLIGILYFAGVITDLLSVVEGVLVWIFGSMFIAGAALLYRGRKKRKTSEEKVILDVTFKNEEENGLNEVEQTNGKAIKKSVLLPDNKEIDKLSVTSSFLNDLYGKARLEAIKINDDALLSYFAIQVYPYPNRHFPFIESQVNIYLNFYSKWANKTLHFQYTESDKQLHLKFPYETPRIAQFKRVFIKVPWQKNPRWMQFLSKAYAKVKPLPISENVCYHLSSFPYNKETCWIVTFEDGLGKSHVYAWDGKGLDENSIVQQ